MKRRHWAIGATGLVLVLLAVWQILSAARGLQVTTLRSSEPPVTFITPKTAAPGSRPLVLIGHGFAGSSVLMRGFALTLAHAGYATVLWDFDGHGTNPTPLPADRSGSSLLDSAEAALAAAQAQTVGDAHRVAILGHSMGSGVALSFGLDRPATQATIAVSPTGQSVTPELPHNLLLMAGSLEGPFVHNAEVLLAEAGGPGGDPALGTARKLIVVPGVEHVSILFSPRAHAAARQWLDAAFGSQPGAVPYTDRRMLWYGVGVLGALLLAAVLAPWVAGTVPDGPPLRPLWRRLIALVAGALGATLLLWLAGQAGLALQSVFGLLVGGYLLLWYGLAGILSLLLLGTWPQRPSVRAVLGGLLAFAALWLGVGLLGQLVWFPWLLIPDRLILWPLGALLLLPWFLAAGEAARQARGVARLAWWLADSAVVVIAIFLALQLSPDLGFLVLVLPIFPIVLLVHALAVAPQRGSWAFALSGALFTSWLLLAVFPLG
jgi:dienelactone hydrolase